MSQRPWWDVFGVIPAAVDEDSLGALYELLAKYRADNPAAMVELNAARDQALRHFSMREGTVVGEP